MKPASNTRLEVLVGLGTLGAALALKLAYSRAGADALQWVLAPSCWLARLGGVALHHEGGAGYISHADHLVVGPACAGVNFLVSAWLALYFCLQGGVRGKLRWSVCSLACAYASTVIINGLRISLAAQLYRLDIYGALLTPARAHALLGVLLYCGALLGLCQLAACRIAQLSAATVARRAYAVYLAVVLGLPILNRAYVREPARFVEHALLTAGSGALVLLAFQLLFHARRGRQRC